MNLSAFVCGVFIRISVRCGTFHSTSLMFILQFSWHLVAISIPFAILLLLRLRSSVPDPRNGAGAEIHDVPLHSSMQPPSRVGQTAGTDGDSLRDEVALLPLLLLRARSCDVY